MFKLTNDKFGIGLLIARTALLSLFLVSTAYAEQEIVAYSDDTKIAQAESLEHLPEGMKAILAMYALQTGGGCGGYDRDRLLVCVLSKSLGLGMQCSEKHLKLVHSWFKNGFPAMSIYPKTTIQREAKSGKLETICYNMPDTSTVQENWETIRVKKEKNFVFVNAIRNWTFQSGNGPFYRIQYKSKYRIDDRAVTVISHRGFPLPEQD